MIVTSTDIKGLKKHSQGKVRDIYDLGDSLLMIATDRLSAFDVVLPDGIPDKGKVLTQTSLFWFSQTKDIVENHIITADTDEIIKKIASCGVADVESYREMLDGRSIVTKKAKPVQIECIVRGYLAGSAWKDYKELVKNAKGDKVTLHGVELPCDMVESQILEEPVFTPSTKESEGHDINISAAKAREIVGDKIGSGLENISLSVYKFARDYAAKRGIIICDTKFEIGEYEGKLILIDEVLTPDSSRFWDAATYKPGAGQPSFDKQFVRDYLQTLDWDKTYPGPKLPDEIIEKTADKYREAYKRITGTNL